ncbi:MAG: hypothetical protein IKC65_03920 [Lentisphaeria bacterium]|nr:hypothetical protein [Lentisphaeria bacterium]
MAVYEGIRIVDNNWQTALNGDVYYDTVIQDYYARMFVSSGGKTERTEISRGMMVVSNGGYASETVLNHTDGRLQIEAGGTASEITADQGHVLVSAGASALNVNIKNNAELLVDVTAATVLTGTSHGKSVQIKDNVISNITMMENYQMFVSKGWTAFDTTIRDYYARTFVSSGGKTERTEISRGMMIVSNGGYASETVLNHNDGRLRIEAGGTARDLKVDLGELNVYTGGKITGKMNFSKNANIKTADGAVVDFDISGLAASEDFILSDYSVISGTPDFTITVSDKQTGGAYKLADHADDFNCTITIGNGELTYGTLQTGGATLSRNGVKYTLVKDNGDLILNVVSSYYSLLDSPVVFADKTEITNQNVTVTATFSPNALKNEFSRDGGAWQDYTGGIVFDKNGSVSFRSSGANGVFSEVVTYTVSNIDKIAPEKPIVSVSSTAPAQKSVTVYASFSTDSVIRQYSSDNFVWQNYQSGVTMTANGTVYFRSMDEAGNYSETVSFTVSNIGTAEPEKPAVYADITSPTRENVTVFANFSPDSVKKEYSYNNIKWNTYENGVEMSFNGTVYFRSTDAAGNVSAVVSYTVSNIDRTAPAAPVITADNTSPTGKNVVLTAIFDPEAVKNEFSLDGKKWQNCTGEVICAQNRTVYFRSTDAAGNVSAESSYQVANIDKVPPVRPQVSADVTTLTNKDVTVTAVFSRDSVRKEYSLDGENWYSCSGSVVMSANGTVYFRSADAAGNVSAESFYEVTNIDRTAPDRPVVSADMTGLTGQPVTLTAVFASDSVLNEYAVNGGNWVSYTGNVVMSDNGTVVFRSWDEAGNISETAYTVSNIDNTPPKRPEVSADMTGLTNKNVTVTAVFASDSVLNEYAVNGGEWLVYSEPVIFSDNGEIRFRSTDELGNVSSEAVYTVGNINHALPDVPELGEYCFVKKNYTAKNTFNKKQDGIPLTWQENAFAVLSDVPGGMIAVLLDAKNTLSSETVIPEGVRTIAGKTESLTVKGMDFKASFGVAGTLNIIGIETGGIEYCRFSAVNVSAGAETGNIRGGKETISGTEKKTVKKGITAETDTFSQTVSAAGKVTVTAASAGDISGYATIVLTDASAGNLVNTANKISKTEKFDGKSTQTNTFSQTVSASGKVTLTAASAGDISGYSSVTLDQGTAENLCNSNIKISKSEKYVGGQPDTVTHTETYSAAGTATLKNGSFAESICGFRTVKLIGSTVNEILLGSSYTEKYTLKKGKEQRDLIPVAAGTVTLENAAVNVVSGMNKVTASKGFNSIGSYTGSDGNDTLTINKNAVLALGAVDMGGGAKDKFVNNGTLVLTGDIDLKGISGKGEIVAAADVYYVLTDKTGVLDLGATAEGFRSSKHENSDDQFKKAVTWDVKSGDYTGWLGSWDNKTDAVDFIKFKAVSGQELTVSGVENFTLYDSKKREVEAISAAGTYILELKWDGTESTSYTLALA